MKIKKNTPTARLASIGLFKSVAMGLALSFLTAACAPTQSPEKTTSEIDFYTQRTALIAKYSKTDNVFSALTAQIAPSDPASKQYWQWRIDQYLYGQYPEYQQIYDEFRDKNQFEDIYPLVKEDLGPKKATPNDLLKLPDGHFT